MSKRPRLIRIERNVIKVINEEKDSRTSSIKDALVEMLSLDESKRLGLGVRMDTSDTLIIWCSEWYDAAFESMKKEGYFRNGYDIRDAYEEVVRRKELPRSIGDI